jgi:phage tail sheath protein FI
MDSSATRYIETILNTSVPPGHPSGLTFTDLALSGTAAERRPANGTFSGLTGGSDGLASLADNDFIGSAAGKTGFYALDLVDEIALLSATGRATSAVHNAMISYCEVWRGMSIFPVLDIPAGLTAQQAVDYVETTAGLLNSSEFGAIYWPRPKVLNPDTAVFGAGANIVVPSSGIICGVYARTDASQLGGVYQPPAGTERGIMRSVVGFETDECLDEKKRDIVFPKRINPLTTGRGKPRYIDGARTLKGNGNFPSVPERRGVIYIEQSIKNGIDYVRHSNNTPELRRDVERTVDNFLNLQMQFGAFRSKDPKTAYFVDFGDGLNPINVAFAGLLIGRVGLATNKIAEFVELRFSQDTRAFDQESASA